MSLYYTQKFMYELNRSERAQRAYLEDPQAALADYELTDTETQALITADIGLLFHLGVNGQILMHFAAFRGVEWRDYLQLMREGIERHGPVREGVYALAGYEGVEAHTRRLHQGAGAREAGAPSAESRNDGAVTSTVG